MLRVEGLTPLYHSISVAYASFLGLPLRRWLLLLPLGRLSFFAFPLSLRGRPLPRRMLEYFSGSYKGVSPNLGSIGIL